MTIKTTLTFVYTSKGAMTGSKKDEAIKCLLCARDDIIGYLEHKRPFPCDITIKETGEND